MKKYSRGGFTLIELSLSLVFIAILSVTVVLLIQNTTYSYRRGLVLNQVNTVGMDLVDDFRVSVQNASSDSVKRMCEMYYDAGTVNRTNCETDNGSSFVLVRRTATVTADGATLENIPIYGAFCTGTYTYVWKSGYFENTDLSQREIAGFAEGTKVEVGTKGDYGSYNSLFDDFRLLKIYDNTRSICVNAMQDQNSHDEGRKYVALDNYTNSRISPQFVIDNSVSSDDEAVELLKTDAMADLVLYDLYVAKPAISSTRQNLFYSASFILGTRRGGININTTGNSCKPPSDGTSELDYCAINKFNFAVQAGGAR